MDNNTLKKELEDAVERGIGNPVNAGYSNPSLSNPLHQPSRGMNTGYQQQNVDKVPEPTITARIDALIHELNARIDLLNHLKESL